MTSKAYAVLPALLVTGLLLAAIYLGSDRWQNLDGALLGYCGATIVAAYATAYHVAAFWRRRPSAFYGGILLRALGRPRELLTVLRTAGLELGGQRVIARRSGLRWLAHLWLAWGTTAGFATTLPLVWGWLRFESAGAGRYRPVVVSLPLASFATDGMLGWLIFHTLHLAAVAVVLGATYFLLARARLRRQPDATSRFHVAPLLLLLGVALTGLALPAAARAGHTYFRLAAISHEAAVIALLVTLPYGKLIHLFIRPLHIGVRLMRLQSRTLAHCRQCHASLAPAAQLAAVQTLLATRGFGFGAHQQLCPSCRRRQLAAVHSLLLGAHFQPQATTRRALLRRAA